MYHWRDGVGPRDQRPKGRIGLSIDEWGTWWTAPKDSPSNLYQQNTLRDAVIAGLTLNIFQNPAERVRMANIAQMVNVPQSMILTRGEKMIVTPTYHVFDLYQVHQSGSLRPFRVARVLHAGEHFAAYDQCLASRDGKGAIHLSIVNLDPNPPAPHRDADRWRQYPTACGPGSVEVTVPAKSVVVLEVR